MPKVKSQYKAYEDAFVREVKDELTVVRDHPIEACGIAVAAGLLLMRGPRRFLMRNTLGRLKSEEARFTQADSTLKELHQSVEQLKKESKNTLSRTKFSEETMQRGRTKLRDAGHEIQRLTKSIYRTESNAADVMDGLREIPGRNALKLRAEVASMVAELKQQRRELDKRIISISEYGIRI